MQVVILTRLESQHPITSPQRSAEHVKDLEIFKRGIINFSIKKMSPGTGMNP
jgi:hypothetical protein